MGTFLVIKPGMLTTIQDLGRKGFGTMGVCAGGAADTLALRACNMLLGNDDGAAALEMTLTGATIQFENEATMALSAGVTAATVTLPCTLTRAVKPLEIVRVAAGDRLTIGPIIGNARGYLCVRGGIEVPPVLRSASTHLGAGFGGYHGRALLAGDRVEFHGVAGPAPIRGVGRSACEWLRAGIGEWTIAAIDGPHRPKFNDAAVALFWSSAFKVSPQSNRIGVRLLGPSIAAPAAGNMVSEGMPPGAVQVPESGQPIVLGVDHPTTGGYPLIACVATADLCILGRVRPGDTVRFRSVSLAEARELLRDQERRFRDLFEPP